MYRGECNKSCSARDLRYINWFIVWCHRRFEFKLHSCIQRWVASYGSCAMWVISKALSCYQPQFDETQMGWSVEVLVQFDLRFPEFTDPDYEHYATLLDGISDLDVLFADDLLKPEWPPSKQFKHCAYAEEATSAASALKDVTNHKWFGPITTLPEREKAVHGVILSNTVAEFSGGTKPVLGTPQPNPFAYTFSGSFSNCTINVSLK